jgi:ferric iron reductase protein FhuF
VAIIIGKETKKLLHIGVHNKYCYLCNHKSSKPHTCFMNWDQDSQSTEGDIILEGFLEDESKHGLRYMRLVGDGDSSVFSRMILEKTEGTRLGEICCQRRVC